MVFIYVTDINTEKVQKNTSQYEYFHFIIIYPSLTETLFPRAQLYTQPWSGGSSSSLNCKFHRYKESHLT